MKLTQKQKEIIWYMQEGLPLMISQGDTTNNLYYMIGSTHNSGYGNTYFRSDVFGALLEKGLIHQQLSHPFDWVLTELGESIVFKKCPIKQPI